MRVRTSTLRVQTEGTRLKDITRDVAAWLGAQVPEEGLLTLFVRHTSASLLIQENADPAVLYDLQRFFEKLAPWSDEIYAHRTEGEDDMPAHIRAALTQTSLSVPVVKGHLALGQWQAIYLWEHRARGQVREVVLTYLGE